jgi:hypothetical protein
MTILRNQDGARIEIVDIAEQPRLRSRAERLETA